MKLLLEFKLEIIYLPNNAMCASKTFKFYKAYIYSTQQLILKKKLTPNSIIRDNDSARPIKFLSKINI